MNFKNQSVRDLAWAVSSSPLVLPAGCACVWPEQHWFQRAFAETADFFEETDAAPAELDALLAGQKDRRLGKYFETLWHYWFSHHPRYQVLEHNLQVIIDGETLGEIDFIILDKQSGLTVHWEVAVKFYLGTGDTRKMCNWYGPNLRDRLDLKVSHLLERQSILSQDARVQSWLQEKSISIDACAVILKGRLYYPWRSIDPSADLSSQKVLDISYLSPVGAADRHEYSWWLTRSQFDDEISDSEKIIPLLNQGWLENILTESVRKSDSKPAIFLSESNNLLRFPLHVQLCKPHYSYDRVFLTGDDWPMENI